VALSVAAQNNGLYLDQRLADYVNLVGMTVVNASPWADRPIYFAVLNSTAVNAYSGPNGHVLITYGALMLMQDESELAGVLAHEVGHVTHEHGLAAVRRANVFAAGLDLARTDSDIAQLGQASDFLVEFLTTQGFDQPAEMEADAAAIEYVTAAGYDPNGYLRFLQRLGQQQSGGGVFSTHPATGERVERAVANIAALGAIAPGQSLAERYGSYMPR
jgi:predicted Zn-dependent protease